MDTGTYMYMLDIMDILIFWQHQPLSSQHVTDIPNVHSPNRRVARSPNKVCR